MENVAIYDKKSRMVIECQASLPPNVMRLIKPAN